MPKTLYCRGIPKIFSFKKNAENDKKERKPKKQKLRLTFYQV